MTRTIVLLPAARRDLAVAVHVSEQRRTGSGARLADEIQRAFERLQASPYSAPEVREGIRKLVLRRFPYTLIYQLLPEHVLVRAIMHQRQHPDRWHDRL